MSTQHGPFDGIAQLHRRTRPNPSATIGRQIDYAVPADRKPSAGKHQGDFMSKSQDAKKNVKKAPTKTPKEKKEAKLHKKATR
jgi:hypothetical protein